MSRSLRVLVGCEFSGVVREAFNAYHGVEAYSCDLLPCEDGRTDRHLQCDIRTILNDNWDAAIIFPDCTFVCSSGLHWNKRRPERALKTEEAVEFFRFLHDYDIPHMGLENPIGCLSTRIRKPDQIIQPWQFGHPESKSTCLWLKNLPLLVPTNVLPKPACGRWENQTPSGQNKLGPSEDRWKDRARTYSGIAAAMASQWVPFLLSARGICPSVNAVMSPGAPQHGEHYHECPCLGPHNAGDEGYEVIEIKGRLWAVPKK